MFEFLIICILLFLIGLIYVVSNLLEHRRIVRWRNSVRVGDYCTFKLNGEMVIGFISIIWRKQNLVGVKHIGTMHKITLDEIYP